MLQINKMAQAITKLIEDIEKLQAEVEEIKEHLLIVPILYQEGDKVEPDERLKNGG